jgi:NAD(P)-dependent dehydrogenase (short-subunit alcohol dehydrogenase family)
VSSLAPEWDRAVQVEQLQRPQHHRHRRTARRGIRTDALCPGTVDTSTIANGGGDLAAALVT